MNSFYKLISLPRMGGVGSDDQFTALASHYIAVLDLMHVTLRRKAGRASVSNPPQD